MKKDYFTEYNTPLHDRSVHALLYKLMSEFRAGTLLISFALYNSILLLFGDFLKISCNYFVVIPLMAFSFIFGLPGGLASGVLALPSNLLIFKFLGHMEYAPSNLLIAESTGILMGTAMGIQSEYFAGMLREIDHRVITENRLRSALKEKETLLREVNHRVRNNLHIITSLIQLHSNQVDDPVLREECNKLKERVFSISLVHEQLFLENQPLFLDVSRYVDSLIDNMILSVNRQDLKVNKQWPENTIPFGSDRVLYLGLIVHEVVMNSIKHGCPPGKSPVLSVSIQREVDDTYTLTIEDNGPGFKPENAERGLGLRLIESLSVPLDGSFCWKEGTGSSFHLNFRSETQVQPKSKDEISR